MKSEQVDEQNNNNDGNDSTINYEDFAYMAAGPTRSTDSSCSRPVAINTMLFVVMCVLLSVMTVTLVSSSKNSQDFSSPPKSPSSTWFKPRSSAANNLSPEERLWDLLVNDDVVQSRDVLLDPSTVQYKALDWLRNIDKWWDIDTVMLDDNWEQHKQRIIDRFVLAVLFFATGGEGSDPSSVASSGSSSNSWKDQLGFLSSRSVCEWPEPSSSITTVTTATEHSETLFENGVRCDASGFVNYVRLDANNLQGPIPLELGSLAKLTTLSLANNALHGTIPTRLQSLMKIVVLDLSTNKLTGVLPSEFSSYQSFHEMQTLSLHSNQLSGALPFGLAGLQHISLHNNKFTGTIPHFPLTSYLREVRLDRNLLVGSIPNSLKASEHLIVLDLSDNLLSGSIPQITGSDLNKLRELYLHNNQFRGTISRSLSVLESIVELQLQHNQLTGSLPKDVERMGTLERCFLYNNHFTGTIPTEFGEVRSLVELDVSNNNLTGTVPTALGDLSQLLVVRLLGNNITGDLDSVFCNNTNSQGHLVELEADCGGTDHPVNCSCCTSCCAERGNVSCDRPREWETVCDRRLAHQDESHNNDSTSRGRECACHKDGRMFSCRDTACKYCNADKTACYVDSSIATVINTDEDDDDEDNYKQKDNNRRVDHVMEVQFTTKPYHVVRYVDYGRDGCEASIDGTVCNRCRKLICTRNLHNDDKAAIQINCENVAAGITFNGCSKANTNDNLKDTGGDGPFSFLASGDYWRGECIKL